MAHGLVKFKLNVFLLLRCFLEKSREMFIKVLYHNNLNKSFMKNITRWLYISYFLYLRSDNYFGCDSLYFYLGIILRNAVEGCCFDFWWLCVWKLKGWVLGFNFFVVGSDYLQDNIVNIGLFYEHTWGVQKMETPLKMCSSGIPLYIF